MYVSVHTHSIYLVWWSRGSLVSHDRCSGWQLNEKVFWTEVNLCVQSSMKWRHCYELEPMVRSYPGTKRAYDVALEDHI